MRKNRTMRVAALLLALTLITSCFVGGTFAKYITTNQAKDTATVARWGFQEPVTVTFNLFDMTDDTGIAADGLIAPGSSKTVDLEFINAQTGDAAPQVAYEVKVEFTEDTTASTFTALDGAVVWKIGSTEYTTWSAFLDGIKLLSGEADGVKEYAPNDALPAFLKAGETTRIGWEWDFTENGDADDTALGNKATLDSVTLGIVITVTQLNDYSTP